MKRKFKATRRRFGAKKAYRRTTKSGINPIKIVIPAAIYGAGRGYLSNLAAPLTSKIPLGSYADEAVFGVLGYFLSKKGKGIVKQIGTSMLIVEAASMGNQLIGGIVSKPSAVNNDDGYTFY